MTDQQMMTPTINVAPLFDSNLDAWILVDRLIGEACRRKSGFVVTGLPLPQQNFSFERFFKIFELPDPVLYDIANREMRPDSRLTMRGYLNRNKGGFAYGEQFDLGTEESTRTRLARGDNQTFPVHGIDRVSNYWIHSTLSRC
jgi:isopenicillin N synthase-like dioxygenase